MVLILLLMISSVFGMDEDITNYKGNIRPKTSFMHKLAKIFSTQQTVINGALCSTYPDWQKESILNVDKMCWKNWDGGSPGGHGSEHQGVAYLVYMWDDVSQRYHLLKEVKIPAGQKGCVDIPKKGIYYLREAYFCDKDPHGCTDKDRFKSVCHTNTRTKRQRQCAGHDVETVWVNYVDWSVPWCKGTEPTTCNKVCTGTFYLDPKICECVCGLTPNDCSPNEYLDLSLIHI